MVISFYKQFVNPILHRIKIHTIREDKKNRWKIGMKMHMATGVRTKKYTQFSEEVCIGIQNIEIKYITHNIGLVSQSRGVKIFLDGRDFTNDTQLDDLIKNDGFENRVDFFKWFNKDFKGKILHWTDKKY